MDLNKKHSDCTLICDEQIPIIREMIKTQSRFSEAIELLYHLEKLTRTAADAPSCTRVLTEMVHVCVQCEQWEKLNECILLVTKRQSLLKESVSQMIQECVKVLDKTKSKKDKVALIETLRSVTEGKIYVEIERARLTRMYADIKEAEGNIDLAATLMSELKVESYGLMNNREKTELILHQMRLLLLKQNFEQARILAKKINEKFLENPDQEDLKLKYYKMRIIMDCDNSYLATSRNYQALFNCSSVDEKEKLGIMLNIVAYCILAPFDNEQKNLMENLLHNKYLDNLPKLKIILRLFLTMEIIDIECFIKPFRKDLNYSKALNEQTSHGQKCWRALGDRLIEHNILVISTYYTRIYLKRMSELLKISEPKCEEYIANLVNSQKISVKIDRPSGIVSFRSIEQPPDMLNAWTSQVNDFMVLVNKTCHLINKETCVHCHKADL